MKKLLLSLLSLAIVLTALTVSIPTASAASLVSHVSHTSPRTVKPLTCTPGIYYDASQQDLRNSSGGLEGSVDLLADGCGWVQATIYSYSNTNHIQAYLVRASDFSIIVISPTAVGNSEQTIHLKTNGVFFYASGCVWDDPIYGYSGCATTGAASNGSI